MSRGIAGAQETVNPDLARERQNCTFNPVELSNILDGGAAKTAERRTLEDEFLRDPELQSPVPLEYLSHKEKYEEAVRKACIVFKKLDKMGVGSENYGAAMVGLGGAVIRDGNPLSLHHVMFIPTLTGQGTLEQQALWVSRARSNEIIGTYAQTELGHGTFIRGLETTATYDPKAQEFVLTSPTLTSYKWWPGGLAHTANYAVVVAQLHTQGKAHGIHPFIVQLRDEDTHMPLKGIQIGEIGTKLGMNTVNNGYLGFENVRIPRESMLMKNSQVLPDGTFVKAPSSKLAYGTMVFVRVGLVRDAANHLGKAVTIATRYSAVRRQSEMKPGEREPQIMEYRTQQFKLLPNIAAVYCFRFAASWLRNMYNIVTAELETGDLERLPELHAISCCLKAVATSEATQGIDTVRMSCGGHGYMTSSNLPLLFGLASAACTYEGENTVLFLQTARYLVKQYQGARAGQKMTPTMTYLSEVRHERAWDNSIGSIVLGFKEVAAGKVKSATDNIEQRVRGGYTWEDAWNMTSIELTQAAEAHCRAFLVGNFHEAVEATPASPAVKLVLRQLVQLYAVHWLLQRTGDFLRFSSLRASQVGELQTLLETLLTDLRPNAVGIVDGFDYCDEILGSTLGAYDGRVYERLFEEAKKSPLNQEPVNSSFHKYLKPYMRSKM